MNRARWKLGARRTPLSPALLPVSYLPFPPCPALPCPPRPPQRPVDFLRCLLNASRPREVCVICTANSDEFSTFEPESYRSSRSHDCLLRAVRSFARAAAAPSITRSVKRAHLRSMIRSRGAFKLTVRSTRAQNERYRNKICPRLSAGRSSFLVRLASAAREKRG